MKLVANNLNQTYLCDILPATSEDVQVDVVLAAIAYGSSSNNAADDLVGHCHCRSVTGCGDIMMARKPSLSNPRAALFIKK